MALPPSITSLMAAASQRTNAQRLAANPDALVNGNTQADIDNGLYAGDTTGAQFDTSRSLAGADDLETPPSIQALEQAAEFSRRNNFESQQASDADLLNGHATARAMGKANIENQTDDVLSEGAAGRQMLPNASALYGRNQAAKLAEIKASNIDPVVLRNEGNLATAQVSADARTTAADARTTAANAKSKSEQDTLAGAVKDLYAKWGTAVTPRMVHDLQQHIQEAYGLSAPSPGITGLVRASGRPPQ